MRIVLGTGVSGELASNQVRGKVPFTTLVRYDYDSIEDMVAGNDAVWLKSKDNKSWETMDEYSGRSAIPFFMGEAGDYYVKAKICFQNVSTLKFLIFPQCTALHHRFISMSQNWWIH